MRPFAFPFFRAPRSSRAWVRTTLLLLALAGITASPARADEALGALREAVQRGDPAEVARFIAAAPADQRDRDAVAALVWSAYYGEPDLLNAMLRCRVPVTATDEHGSTALAAAVRGNQPGAVDILLAHGANADAPAANGGASAAALATQLGRTAIVARLQHGGSSTAGKGTPGTFAAAVQGGQSEPVKTSLADPAVRVNGKAAQVATVLAASRGSQAQLTDDLLAAVKKGDAPAVQTLLDQGADPQSCNKLKWPVAVLAASRGHTEILRLPCEKDHDTVWRTAPGQWSPLLEAAGNGHLETVQFLLAHHAEPEIVNDFGGTPLDYAESRHYPEVAQVLRAALSQQASRSNLPLARRSTP